MQQRDPEWFATRCGKLTGSRFNDVMNRTKKGEPGAYRKNLMVAVALERLTGQPHSIPANAAMQWGTDHEDEARIWYEFENGTLVDEVAFIQHETVPYVGVSPDGLVGNGGVEIKCPYNLARHFDTLTTRTVPPEYVAQVQGCMWVSGRDWWDYVSYHPLFPPHLCGVIIPVARDNDYIARLEAECESLNDEIEATLAQLTEGEAAA